MLELYGGKKKDREKLDTSDHSADSSNASSPAGYSPSAKKRVWILILIKIYYIVLFQIHAKVANQ